MTGASSPEGYRVRVGAGGARRVNVTAPGGSASVQAEEGPRAGQVSARRPPVTVVSSRAAAAARATAGAPGPGRVVVEGSPEAVIDAMLGLAGPPGPVGPQGPQGPPGIGLAGIEGTMPSRAYLPAEGDFIGQAWITDDDGALWVWKEAGMR